MYKFRLKKPFFICIVSIIFIVALFARIDSSKAFAETDKYPVTGNVYEFDKDEDYEFSKAEKSIDSEKANTYGNFAISGNIGNITQKNGVPAYEVKSGNLKLHYNYGNTMLKIQELDWHIIDDKGKKIDGKKLDEKILKGALILQTSNDRKNWADVKILTNEFSKKPIRTDSLYETKDVQILNGCYYRLIVAYEARKLKKVNKVLFVPFKDYKYKKTAEVYEFYASRPIEKDVTTSEQTYSLGKKTKVKEFDGYSGHTKLKKDDIHYGWDIGQFYVSDYTDKVKEANGNVVFLKNVGDTVTLWFNLQQNINKLNGNENLRITADTEGYDQYFETPRTNFGKGALIIRHTDYNNNSSEPKIYTNYLEANATVGSDTKVQLFEEGDYEIALDYEVTSDKLIDRIRHYRIYFTFSVRNGNCMVFPMDVSTGSELTNSSMTENGFTLDLAKSRYLKINVKREILTDSGNGLVEDTRSNGPARDGEKYVNEGIYTITATNKYTNQTTTKKIYVGTNNLMKAYMTTGLSIEEINKLVSEGATIDDSGIITLATNEKQESEIETTTEQNSDEGSKSIPIVAGIIIAIVAVAVIFWRKNFNKHIESMEDK